jgi:hypothetical protein
VIDAAQLVLQGRGLNCRTRGTKTENDQHTYYDATQRSTEE